MPTKQPMRGNNSPLFGGASNLLLKTAPTRFKFLIIIMLMVSVVLFSFAYFNGHLSRYSLSWGTNAVPSATNKLIKEPTEKEQEVVIFLWDAPADKEQDWTGILKSRHIYNQQQYLDHQKWQEESSSTANIEQQTSSTTASVSQRSLHGNQVDDSINAEDDEYEDENEQVCDVSCTFTHNQADLPLANYIVFDPSYLPRDDWRRMPLNFPEKHPHQRTVLLNYYSKSQYPIITDQRYNSLVDLHLNYTSNSSQPITLACPPNPSFKTQDTIKLLFQPHHADWNTRRDIVFVSSNCKTGFAKARTNYVKGMNTHILIESYGICLEHASKTETIKGKDINQRVNNNMKLFRGYKFAITFENENATDFVSEKVYSALFSGAIPVYMGAPNIDDWVPSGSIIKASDYQSPQALADYIKSISKDPEATKKYFEWKSKPLEEKVKNKLRNCLSGFHSKCMMCKKAVEMLSTKEKHYKEVINSSPLNSYHPFHLQMQGKGDHIKITTERCPHCMDLSERYTIMAWVKPTTFGDQRILDKNMAGKIDGYNFDIQKASDSSRGVARLCAGGTCFSSHISFSGDVWTHIAVTYSVNNANVHENKVSFYINGREDIPQEFFNPTEKNNHPVLIGFPATSPLSDSGSYHGNIDNIGVFNRTLTQDEIIHLMWNRPFGDEKDLLLYYDFDVNPAHETNKNMVNDLSPHKNHGVLVPGKRSDAGEKVLSYGKDYSFNKCL